MMSKKKTPLDRDNVIEFPAAPNYGPPNSGRPSDDLKRMLRTGPPYNEKRVAAWFRDRGEFIYWDVLDLEMDREIASEGRSAQWLVADEIRRLFRELTALVAGNDKAAAVVDRGRSILDNPAPYMRELRRKENARQKRIASVMALVSDDDVPF